MYKIIGADGRQYGPVSAEQLRQWIAEGRANAQTQTLTDGAPGWKPLGAVPEFAGYFASAAPPTIAPLKPGFAGSQPPRIHSLATAGFICGILSVTCLLCCYGFPLNVLGLIFSIIALVQISEQPSICKGRGLAIAGLVFSAISLLLLTFALASGHTNVLVNSWQF